MGYETYKNHHNPHITIHKDTCRQLRKNGGEHKYEKDNYKRFASFEEALAYAETIPLKTRECYFCKPGLRDGYLIARKSKPK